MPKRLPPVKISSVLFTSAGTNADFNAFLKAVVFDYLTDKTTAPTTPNEKKSHV